MIQINDKILVFNPYNDTLSSETVVRTTKTKGVLSDGREIKIDNPYLTRFFGVENAKEYQAYSKDDYFSMFKFRFFAYSEELIKTLEVHQKREKDAKDAKELFKKIGDSSGYNTLLAGFIKEAIAKYNEATGKEF